MNLRHIAIIVDQGAKGYVRDYINTLGVGIVETEVAALENLIECLTENYSLTFDDMDNLYTAIGQRAAAEIALAAEKGIHTGMQLAFEARAGGQAKHCLKESIIYRTE